jgi:hypothetical protein
MKEQTELTWFWPYDKKMHHVKIVHENGSVDFDQLRKAVSKLIEDQEDMCKSIYELGIGLTGSFTTAHSFMFGWLVRSLKDGLEKQDGKWTIQHEEESKSDGEIQTHLVTTLRELADEIEKNDSFSAKDAPVIKDGNDQTNLFK